MWSIKSIIIVKIGTKGEASVRLEDDDDTSLVLNKILINPTDTNCPISVVKFQDVPVLSGSLIPGLFDNILEVWNNFIKDFDNGMYEVTKDGISEV